MGVPRIYVYAALLSLSGCLRHSSNVQDFTSTKNDPLIGRCFELTEDLLLVRQEYPKWFALAPMGSAPPHTRLAGSVTRGTRFVITRTQRRTIHEFFVYPAYFAFAEIELEKGRPQTVEVARHQILPTAGRQASNYLRPCPEASGPASRASQ